MAGQGKYKIKISPARTLGPLDLERVRALVMKGRLLGDEPTAAEPFTAWKPFSEFPELGQLMLEKIDKDKAERAATVADATKTISQTKTASHSEMAAPSTGGDSQLESDLAMPTLVNIDVSKLRGSDDTEKTTVNIPRGAARSETDENATKILTLDQMQRTIKKYAEAPTDQESAKRIQAAADEQTKKKRVLSPMFTVFIGIAFCLFLILAEKEETSPPPKERLSPAYYRFPFTEVNLPPMAKSPNADESRELLDEGLELMEKETPLSYIKAVKFKLYKSVSKNPRDLEARAALASAYLRLAEIVPKNERLFKSVKDLLNVKVPTGVIIPSFWVARAEFYSLLNRQDIAEEILNEALKSKPTPEVFFQKAKLQADHGKIELALTTMSRLANSVGEKMNPRHATLHASLLMKRNQTSAAEKILKNTIKQSKQYGPARVLLAQLYLKSGKFKESLEEIAPVLKKPDSLDRMALAEAFLITAEALEGSNRIATAIVFAESARNILPLKDEAEEILFRLKAKHKKTMDVYTHVLAGKQREKAQEFELAIAEYLKASDLSSVDPMPHVLLGKLLENDGDIPGAIKRYERAADSKKKPIEPLLYLAKIYLNRFDLEEANKTLRRADALGRQQQEVEYLRGLVEEKEGKKEVGPFTLRQAVEKGSRNPNLFTHLGEIEEAKLEYELAEFYYSMALRYDPQNPDAMLGVAMARYHLESPSRAINFLKDRLAELPNSAAIMVNLAVVYIKSGDRESGKNLLQNAARNDKKYPRSFKLLGDLTKEEGDAQGNNFIQRKNAYRFALASYEYYSKLAPNDPSGFKSIADLYFEIRDLGAAAKNYHRVLNLVPNYPGVRVRLAQISRNGGDLEAAMKLLEDELKNRPGSDAAKLEQAEIHKTKGEMAEALRLYTEAAQLNERNADALMGIGYIHERQGNYDNALSLYERVVKIDPLNSEVHWRMGEIYEKKSDRIRALQAFKNFLALTNLPENKTIAQRKINQIEQLMHR
jgi:tetratricopeptide (TPR) repeat protein